MKKGGLFSQMKRSNKCPLTAVNGQYPLIELHATKN